MLNIEVYRPIIEFLALFLGAEAEIILTDTEKVLLIEHPMVQHFALQHQLPHSFRQRR